MRYAKLDSFEVVNGEGVGVSLFVQGCKFHCKGCFNSETWNFNDGKEWTPEIENQFIELASKPYIKRISILGGSPLMEENLNDVYYLIKKIRDKFGDDKKIWLFTGFTWEQIFYPAMTDDFNLKSYWISVLREEVVMMCDVLVDGRFEEDKKDLTLKFRGSSNQRLINVKESLEENKIVLLN